MTLTTQTALLVEIENSRSEEKNEIVEKRERNVETWKCRMGEQKMVHVNYDRNYRTVAPHFGS